MSIYADNVKLKADLRKYVHKAVMCSPAADYDAIHTAITNMCKKDLSEDHISTITKYTSVGNVPGANRAINLIKDRDLTAAWQTNVHALVFLLAALAGVVLFGAAFKCGMDLVS